MRLFDDAGALGAALPGGWLSIGNFDGMHAGHRHVLGRLVERARADGAAALAMTFRPHPAALLSTRGAPPRLASDAQQHELFAACGLDGVLSQRFDATFAEMGASAFRDDWLLARMRVRGVIVGANFRFGRNRAGDLATLRDAAPGLAVEGLEPLLVEGEVASSSRVRGEVAAGSVDAAWRLLGRPHAVEGCVIAGDRRGRTLGFPTANVASADQLLPLAGVYATTLRVGDRRLSAVSNVGTRPTFMGTGTGTGSGGGLVHEVHALEDPGDLYGRVVRVAFLQRLRDEKRFDSIDALIAQIRADIAESAPVHAAHPPSSLAGPAF